MFDVSTVRPADTPPPYLVMKHTENHFHIHAIIYHLIYQYINHLLHKHISCISGWRYDKHTAQRHIELAQFSKNNLKSVLYIKLYFKTYI
jgi:hypothetical protein